jgi:hypothetical protein
LVLQQRVIYCWPLFLQPVRVIKLIILCCLFSLVGYLAKGQVKTVPNNLKDTVPLKVDSLKSVTVTASLRPHIKGDTLEYNVEHLAMQPNAVVEDILRRLPGLQVDINGNIIYNVTIRFGTCLFFKRLRVALFFENILIYGTIPWYGPCQQAGAVTKRTRDI